LNWLKLQWHNVHEKYRTLDIIERFLRYPMINNVEMAKWHMFTQLDPYLDNFENIETLLKFILNFRQERSVVRTFYLQYKDDIEKKGFYNPKSDYVFSRTIQDPNYLTQLLADTYNKWQVFETDDVNDGIWFINFIKEKYDEKNVARLFLKEYYAKRNIWKDIMPMVSVDKNTISKNFIKTKCSLQYLHDEFIRCNKVEKAIQDNINFEYNEDMLNAQSRKDLVKSEFEPYTLNAEDSEDNFTIRLPISSEELYGWAAELDNCMFSYVEEIELGLTTVFGVFENNKLLYAIEIKDDKIEQASGYKNRDIGNKHLAIIQNWSSRHFKDGRFSDYFKLMREVNVEINT